MSPDTLRQVAVVADGALPTASRASWVGQLKLGSILAPIKAYPAIASAAESRLHQLHAGCGQRIEYRKWCPEHGAIEAEAIIKGYPYAPNSYVELQQEDLVALEPADDKTLLLERFFKEGQLDLALLAGRSLYLTPANPAARRPYAAIWAALLHKGKWALGRVVFSGRRQMVVVYGGQQVLVLHTLHDPIQRRSPLLAHDFGPPNPRDVRAVERLIDTDERLVNWGDYGDDRERKLIQLVEAKLTAARTSNGASTRARKRNAAANAETRSPSPRKAGRNGCAEVA